MEVREVYLSDVLGAIWSRKWLYLAIVLVAGGGTLVYTIVIPPLWRARAAILLAQPESPRTAIPILQTQQVQPIKVLKGVLESDTAIGRLRELSGYSYRDTRDKLDVVDETQANQLIITFKDKNSSLAQRSVETCLELLEELDSQMSFNVAERQAELLKTAIDEKTKELEAAQQRLVDFQKTMRVPIKPEKPEETGTLLKTITELELNLVGVQKELSEAKAQAKKSAQDITLPSALPASETWRQKLVDLQYALRIAEINEGDDSPNVKRLREEIVATRKQLEEEISKTLRSINSNIDKSVAELEAKRVVLTWQLAHAKELAQVAPNEAAQAQRLLYEVNVLEEVLTNIRAQYEKAMIDSQVAKIRWSVLEKPHIEERAINKRYALYPAIGVLAGILLVFSIAIIGEFRRVSSQRSTTQDKS